MLPLQKVSGGDNPADLMTKNVGIDLAIKHMAAMGIGFEGGRASSTAQLHIVRFNDNDENNEGNKNNKGGEILNID